MNILKRIFAPTPKPKIETLTAVFILRDGREIPLIIKKSQQTTRLRLRLDRGGKAILITAPMAYSEKRAFLFANQSRDWIEMQIAKTPKGVHFENNTIVSINGVPTRLLIAPPRTRPAAQEGVLFIPSAAINFESKAKIILKKLAHEAAQNHLDKLLPLLARKPSKLRITDTKSRWGSCSHDGVISLCWRLILAPPEVFEYVIAHELAHLKEMNHSALFWAEVKRICPDYKVHYKWLKANGAALHMIGS